MSISAHTYKHGKTIAIFRSGRMGDFLVALPALKAIKEKYPNCRIIYITFISSANRVRKQVAHYMQPDVIPPWIELVKPDLIDEVLLLKATFDIPSIRSARLIIAAQDITKTYILPYPSETSKRLWIKMLYLRLLGVKGRIYGWRKSVPLQTPVAEAALSPLGPEALARFREGNLFYRPKAHAGGGKILEDKIFKSVGVRFAIVYAGSTHEHKRWPLTNFVTLCRKLVGEYGFLIVLVGSKSEKTLHEQLKNKIGVHSCINVAGDTSLTDLAHILQRASLFIGNDGGIAHLASTMGTQTITIMSGIYPSGVWDPSGANCMAVRVQGLPCIGCASEDTCPAGHMSCIRNLSVNDVLTACLSRL